MKHTDSSERHPLRLVVPIIAALAVSLVASGCLHTVVARDLGADPLDRKPLRYASRDCAIYVERPVDERPAHERQGGSISRYLALVPLLPLMWAQRTEAMVYQDAASLRGPQLLEDVQKGVRTTIANSNICKVAPDLERATLVLSARLEHAFAVSYEQKGVWFTLGAGGTDDLLFYPAGQVTLELTLRKVDDAQAATTWRLGASALFDAERGGTTGSLETMTGPSAEYNRSVQVVEAMRRCYAELPGTLDRAVSTLSPSPADAELPSEIIVTRQLEDYGTVEQAIIETATGRVVASAIVPRRDPIVSRPEEWVLTPYQPSYLPPAAHRRLVAQLSKRFDVRFEDNLTAARFRGLRDDGSAAVSRRSPIGPGR